MLPDKWHLYRLMYYSRLFEKTVMRLWNEGKIFGEMHMGIGEEAIMAGIVSQLREGDALSLDHRGTSPLLIRGCDPRQLIKEFLGQSDGLCAGMGGHMHLFSKDLLAASSGIVGASGPAALGFALAMIEKKSESVTLCFFGEGAINQGMLMESLNLSVIWKLPILFICKDNDMAITTKSTKVTGGKISSRASSFGMPADEIDGTDVEIVWEHAKKALEYSRGGHGPYFLHCHCVHFEGHFLGDPILRQIRHPLKETANMALPFIKSLSKKRGSSVKQRKKSIDEISALFSTSLKDQLSNKRDPVAIMRKKLSVESNKLLKLENDVKHEINIIIDSLNNL